MLGKIRDKYQGYCTMYKTHAMATYHGGRGCPLDRCIDLNAEDPEQTLIMRTPMAQTLLLPWEDQRQKDSPMTLYTAIRIN